MRRVKLGDASLLVERLRGECCLGPLATERLSCGVATCGGDEVKDRTAKAEGRLQGRLEPKRLLP